MNQYVWFAVGLVGSFILFGVIPNMRDELDESARDNGFLSATDQRAADQTGVTDAATWRQRREQADAAKAAAAEAARKAGAAEAEAEARRLNREAEEAKAERAQRADEQLDADKVAKAEAALRAQQAKADEAEKARRATEQVDAAKAVQPADPQKGAAAMPCIIRGGKKECLPAKASP
jgi:cytoskeletal protein RodZ